MPMPLPERLAGYGVTLRRWRPGDVEQLHRVTLESIEHLRPWMDWVSQEGPMTVEERRTMLESWERDWQAGGDALYAILVEEAGAGAVKGSGEAVAGGCGLHHRGGPVALEIGYWIHPSFLRRGIATAAARLLTDAAFSVPGIERVEIHHDKANLRSRAVPERLGYEFVGEAPDEPAAPAEMGIDCIWRMERAAWRRAG